jgi:HlyD family secretion protein
MTMTRWLKAASVLLVAGATVAGVDLVAQKGTSSAQAQPEQKHSPELVTYNVMPGKLRVTVVDRGSVESSRNHDLFCNVEGNTTIVKIAPEGTRVKAGDVVCELDSSLLRDHLVNQRILTEGAEANYLNAKLEREVAQIAISEYREGTFKHELAAVRGEIAAAQSAIQKAQGRLERTRQARRRWDESLAGKGGQKTPEQIVIELDLDDRIDAAEQTLLREKIALDLLHIKQDSLQNYTRNKVVKTLEIDVQQKQALELAKNATWHSERSKESKLERQIAACTLKAPVAGIVVYHSQIEEGATVRERQKILSIPDLSRMQVNAKIREAWVDKLVPGQKAKVRVDAFADGVLDGVVLDVAPLPDPMRFNGSGIRVYTTHIRIDNLIEGLRPGMTAEVEVLVTELDNVLSVPIESLLVYDGKYYDIVAVKKPGGGFEWRDVILGTGNEKFVEIKEGIRSGEAVILNPISLMNEEEKRAKFSTPTRRAAAKGKGRAKTSPEPKTQP